MKPYGMSSGKFAFRQMFQKRHLSRQGSSSERRGVKKSVRQQARREFRDCFE